MNHKKLVRDKIPSIIKEKRKLPITHIADDEEYWRKLKEKLKEEVDEFLNEENEEELADILEVIDAICKFKNIDKKKLEFLKEKKRGERGGFENRIILDEVR